MSLFSRKNGTDNWNEVDAMLKRMQLGIKVFEQDRGCMPAAMLLDYDMFWRTLNSEHIIIKPGHIVEFDGVRVFASPDLDGKLYLVEHLYEVPDVIFLGES